MKKLFLLTICIFVFSCGQNTSTSNQQSAQSKTNETSEVGKSNFAVTWTWTTTNIDFIEKQLPKISKELTNLWESGIVENIYFDSEPVINKLEYLPNIAFFLKADTRDDVKSILNDLTVVKQGIASFQLHPVGLLWLDRKTEAIQQRGLTRSFVTVWTTKKFTPSQELLSAQNDQILNLWNQGLIENVYFDVEGTQRVNEKTDFVFFVNVESKKEAVEICQNLPFFKEKIATYQIFQAGHFWMGKNNHQ